MMAQHSGNPKLWLVIGVAVVVMVVLVVIVWPHLRGPVAVPGGEMPEAPLPREPWQAEIAIGERAIRDQMRGLDEETCRKRHQQRLKQLEEIKKQAAAEQP